MLKVGEVRPGVLKGKGTAAKANGNGLHQNHYHNSENGVHNPRFSLGGALSDAVAVMHTLRGLQWQFGRGAHVPKHTRPLRRSPFLLATLQSFLTNFLILDFFESLIKLFPGVGHVYGGSMFYPGLSPLLRYTVSTTIHIMTGTCLLTGFGMVYDLITLIAVGVFNDSPLSWPPIMDNPWTADSMHAFWAKHWHQLLRQTFLVLGGYPGKWLAGDMGMLFGTFIASGLFHECSMYSMGRGFNIAVPFFFTLQGVILLLERYWRRMTGKRVHGIWGRLWVYSIMFLVAQPLVDAWHTRGLGGGMVIPPFVSPTRLFLIPAIRYTLH
ncbi:hypothetical protein AX16_007997 [Volvariella volvacea WC 439]|nr:hypothetical protein AX16_007997 [Volvariella volvacea WC 439]